MDSQTLRAMLAITFLGPFLQPLVGHAQALEDSSKPTIAIVGTEVSGATIIRDGKSYQIHGGESLVAGDAIACKDSVGQLELLTATDGPLHWPCDKANSPQGRKLPVAVGESRYTAAVKRYGTVAGRPRGGLSGLMLWPKSDLKMRADTAAQLQWRPQSTGVMTITLRVGASDREVWSETVDATKGRYQSDGLASVLKRESRQGSIAATLQFRVSAAQTDSATFTVLGGEDDRRVEKSLGTLGDLHGTVAFLLRADVFLQEGLQREALDEYVAAVEAVPTSPTFLKKAAGLAVEIGDPRGPELTRKLRALTAQ